MDGRYSTATSYKSDTPVSGGAYQDARKVTLVWNDAQYIGTCLKSEAGSTKRIQAPCSPLSFPAQGKRWGRRRHVRNDHDGTNPCKQGFLSSVLVSSFPNRKLNLRFGFFYANLIQPLSQPAADSSHGRGGALGHCSITGNRSFWFSWVYIFSRVMSTQATSTKSSGVSPCATRTACCTAM